MDLLAPTPSDPTARDESVQARIGDLDLKSPKNGKAKQWIGTERKLTDEGWYAGTESVAWGTSVHGKTAPAPGGQRDMDNWCTL